MAAVGDQVFHRDVDAVMENIPATSGLSPVESKNMSVQVHQPSTAGRYRKTGSSGQMLGRGVAPSCLDGLSW